MRKILVPIDFTEDSRFLAREAVRVGGSCGGELVFLHVIPDPLEFSGFYVPHLSTESLRDEMLADAKDRMAAFVAEHAPSAPGRVEVGVPSREILRVAQEEGVDAIIMGRHPGGMLEHLLFSGASERVIRNAPCAVIIIPLPVGGSHEKTE